MQTVFERHEKKYMLTPAQAAAIQQGMQNHIVPDEYGAYTLCTLYYDTEGLQAARASQDKPAYKEKLRLRSYGTPGANDTVFLELKKKVAGISYKRRLPLLLDEAEAWLEYGVLPKQQSQISREIEWFLYQNNPQPTALLSYDRIAFCGVKDPSLRVTFDSNLRWRGTQLSLSAGDYGTPILALPRILLEVKVSGPLPLWMTRLLSEEKAFPISFSKYGSLYPQLMPEIELPAIQPARASSVFYSPELRRAL